MTATIDWTAASGDVWARRWRDTDRGLSGLAPHLLSGIEARPPAGPFKAFDVGCGPGSTTLAVAEACPNAAITACDISPSLVKLAHERANGLSRVRIVEGDAEALAATEGPFDLVFSRHGVMFFADPVRAFTALRGGASAGASLVFSCFRAWELNPWASELASAAAGRTLPPPGREPGGFAFADRDHVLGILGASGWTNAKAEAVDFRYVAGEGQGAVEHAMSFLSDIGPAARVLEGLSGDHRKAALQRMRRVVEQHLDGEAVVFPAAAWIWSAEAAPGRAA